MRPAVPTLLIFTLGSPAESARRRLLPPRLQDVEVTVRRGCLAMVLEAGRASGCRLEVCSPVPVVADSGDSGDEVRHVPQEGAGFGERLERAVTAAFGRGSSPLLVVGTDVPGLAAAHLEAALARLAEDPDRVVLGPSPDGGFYLLAAARPLPGLAAATRWCRRDTLRRLVAWLEAHGRPVAFLQPLADLDRRADLDRWLGYLAGRPGPDPRWRRLVRVLNAALAALVRPAAPGATGRPRSGQVRAAAGRSPPAPALS